MSYRSRRRDEEHENPAWPGLVDLFAFAMVVTLVLWVAAIKGVNPPPPRGPVTTGTSDADRAHMLEIRRVQELRSALGDSPTIVDSDKDPLSFEVIGFNGREVYFAQGAYLLSVADQEVIRALAGHVAGTLKNHPGFAVLVNGTADPVPLIRDLPPRNNVELSALRAAGVLELLVHAGIDACRLQVVGLGSKAQSASGQSDDDLQRMRRVYLTLRALPKGAQGGYGDCK